MLVSPKSARLTGSPINMVLAIKKLVVKTPLRPFWIRSSLTMILPVIMARIMEATGSSISGARAISFSAVKFFVRLVIIYSGSETVVTSLAIRALLLSSNHFFLLKTYPRPTTKTIVKIPFNACRINWPIISFPFFQHNKVRLKPNLIVLDGGFTFVFMSRKFLYIPCP